MFTVLVRYAGVSSKFTLAQDQATDGLLNDPNAEDSVW